MKNEKSKKKIQWFLFPAPQHGALWGGDGIVSHPRLCGRGATREVMRGGVVEKDLEMDSARAALRFASIIDYQQVIDSCSFRDPGAQRHHNAVICS